MNEEVIKLLLYILFEFVKLFSIYLFVKETINYNQTKNTKEMLDFIEKILDNQYEIDIRFAKEIDNLKRKANAK